MKSIIDILCTSPDVHPDIQRVLNTRHTKQEARKLLAEPEVVTGFGDHQPTTGETMQTSTTTREQHVEWCKQRAREYIEQGNLRGAFTSMASDLDKHDETRGHAAIGLGLSMLVHGHLDRRDEMVKFIEGFR